MTGASFLLRSRYTRAATAISTLAVVVALAPTAVATSSVTGVNASADCARLAATPLAAGGAVPDVAPTSPNAHRCAIGLQTAGVGVGSGVSSPTRAEVPSAASGAASLPSGLLRKLRTGGRTPSSSSGGPHGLSISVVSTPSLLGGVPQPGSFLFGGLRVPLKGGAWVETGWTEGTHCGTAFPTVFTEIGTDGHWEDHCWTTVFPLSPRSNYVFATTVTRTELTEWIYWNGTWFALGALGSDANANKVTDCVAGQCVDAGQEAGDAIGLALTLCSFTPGAPVCAPLATVWDLTTGIINILDDNGLLTSTYCDAVAIQPRSVDSNTMEFYGYAQCNYGTVYAIIQGTDGYQDGSRYGGAGSQCNYCSYNENDFTDTGIYLDYYHARSSYYAYITSETQPTETGSNYSTDGKCC